jgi:hypothetical protein
VFADEPIVKIVNQVVGAGAYCQASNIGTLENPIRPI